VWPSLITSSRVAFANEALIRREHCDRAGMPGRTPDAIFPAEDLPFITKKMKANSMLWRRLTGFRALLICTNMQDRPCLAPVYDDSDLGIRTLALALRTPILTFIERARSFGTSLPGGTLGNLNGLSPFFDQGANSQLNECLYLSPYNRRDLCTGTCSGSREKVVDCSRSISDRPNRHPPLATGSRFRCRMAHSSGRGKSRIQSNREVVAPSDLRPYVP
jgi:hypothetical protein